jgi:hypothetical protein
MGRYAMQNDPARQYRWEDDELYRGMEEPMTGKDGHFEPTPEDRAWWAQQPTRPLPKATKKASRVARMWARPGWRR